MKILKFVFKRGIEMKKKYRNLLIVACSLGAILVAVFGSTKWDQKLELSGAEASLALEKEGISIRTVDTTRFTDPNTTETDQDREDNKQSNNSSTEVASDKPLTSSKEPSKETTDSKAEAPASQTEQGKSLSDIKHDYMFKFFTLEGEISASLDVLIDNAIADYKAKQANNTDGNLKDFQTKLATDIRKLESSSDQQFNQIYQELEVELVASGFSKSEATPFRAQYQAEKKNREQKAVQKIAALVR